MISAPVSTSSLGYFERAALMRAESSTSDTERSETTRMESIFPGCARNSLAVSGSKRANVAPPGDRTAPYDAIPTNVKSRLPAAAVTFTLSPRMYLAFLALAASSAISLPFLGRRPWEMFQSDPRYEDTTAPNVGGPPPSDPSGVPSFATILAYA